MAVIDQSLRGLTRCVAPTRVGALLARFAQRHYSQIWANDDGNEVIAEHLDRGLRMRVDRTHHIGGAIYWRGFHSRRLLRCLDRLLQPQMTFVDVGANQGEVSLYAARRLTQGKVIAFEPVGDHYRRLVANVSLNRFSNVVARNHCLGDRSGEVQLYVTENHSDKHNRGWNEGLASMFAASHDAESFSTVKVRRFDEVFPSLGTDRLDLVKIDVEGAELPVLRGARECLERFRPSIIVEMNADTFKSAGYTPADLCAYLHECAYNGFEITRSGACGTSSHENIPDFGDMLWIPTGTRKSM